ncbi:hypothetical protein VV869_07015 [Photobacterium sp. MCCC 1A19761]|uniref:hypothetical protein n=1 Tax=Photobacterium sp. MCCC 1A19761 TaxID=3115000 RepID=UPI00307F8957
MMVEKRKLPVRQSWQHADKTKTVQRMSMHEGIATWYDCCVCEAEPYWAEVAEELGIELSDDEAGEPR